MGLAKDKTMKLNTILIAALLAIAETVSAETVNVKYRGPVDLTRMLHKQSALKRLTSCGI